MQTTLPTGSTSSLPTGFFAEAPPPRNAGGGDMAGTLYDYSSVRRGDSEVLLRHDACLNDRADKLTPVVSSRKRLRDDGTSFRCDACSLELDSQSAFQAHCASHVKCSECSFTGAPKVVKNHYESMHGRFSGSGFKTVIVAIPGCPVQRFQICVGNNPADIRKWIEERRRKFPRQKKESEQVCQLASDGATDKLAGVSALLTGYSSSEASDGEEEVKIEKSAEDQIPGSEEIDNEKKLITDSRRDVCRFYKRNGSCRSGEACRFSHEQPIEHTFVRKPFAPKNRARDTLLSKLLLNDVKRERCITIQLLEYMVRSDFLDKKP